MPPRPGACAAPLYMDIGGRRLNVHTAACGGLRQHLVLTPRALLVQAATPISRKLQQLCAECLGMLGAVDPSRVQARTAAGLVPSSSPAADGLVPDAVIALSVVCSQRSGSRMCV